MGQPIDPRCTSSPGTEYRVTTPDPPRKPRDYPPLSVPHLRLFGQAEIPDALAYALRWQIELDRQRATSPEPSEAQQKLAENLLTVFDFLLAQEQQVERDPVDGTLLYRSSLNQWAATPVRNPRIVDAFGAITVVTDPIPEPPLPVWAPSVFPREMSAGAVARYPRRPRRVTEIPPFDSPKMVQHWTLLRAGPARPLSPMPPVGAAKPARGTAARANPAETETKAPPPPKPVDARTLDATLDKVIARYDITPPSARATPLITDAIHELSTHTLRDLFTATGTKRRWPWEDDKLIKHTDVIFYHSVYTVVLDRAGNPFDMRATEDSRPLLDYGLVVSPPTAKSEMRRKVPPYGGVNVNDGIQTYRLQDGKISSVSWSVGAFDAVYGGGASEKHELQLAIEAYRSPLVAAVTAKAAIDPADIDLERIYLRLYDLADAATPHVIDECLARAKRMIVNWQDIVTQVVEQVIKEAVLREIRERIKSYLVKTIGKKIVPLVNAVAAIVDKVSGEDRFIRYALICAVIAVRGRTDEDTEIAARVVSKVLADKFEDKIIETAIRRAGEVGAKLVKGKAGKGASSKSEPQPKTEKPGTEPQATGEAAGGPAAGNIALDPQGRVDHKQPVQLSTPDPTMTSDPNKLVRQKLIEAVESSRAPQAKQAPKAATKSGAPVKATATSDTAATPPQHSTSKAATQTTSTLTGDTATSKDSEGTKGTATQPKPGKKPYYDHAKTPPVLPAREWRTRQGGRVRDWGLEGMRRTDPRGMERNRIFPLTDENLKRMLIGRPPLDENGKKIILHHRGQYANYHLDEYTAKEHTELPLHEKDRDSEIDRDVADEQRARHWVDRARRLLADTATEIPSTTAETTSTTPATPEPWL